MSRKTPRNAPCPCGSGLKYKKCCLARDEAVRDASGVATVAAVLGHPPPYGFDAMSMPADALPPYVAAKLFEESERFAEMKRHDPAAARRFWTPKRVAALETETIVARLGELGIDLSPEAFRSSAKSHTSAWELSDRWRETLGRSLATHERSFVGLAACELWKRLCPDRPSVEMLDDQMQDGYRLLAVGRGQQACDRWAEVWAVLRSRLRPEMRTCQAAATAFTGTQLLFNWIQDFAEALQNAALDDARYADTGTRLCEDAVAQFPDESDSFILGFRADLGEFLFLADRHDDAERIFDELIRDYPDRAIGYVYLADILSSSARGRTPVDLPRAQQLLRQALPLPDAADFDVEVRLADLEAPDSSP